MHTLTKKKSKLAFYVYVEIVISAAINIRRFRAGRIALVIRRDKLLNLTEAETERSL